MKTLICRIFLIASLATSAGLASSDCGYQGVQLNSVAGFTNADARSISNGWAVGHATNNLFGGPFTPIAWNLTTGAPTILNGPGASSINGRALGIDGSTAVGVNFDDSRAIAWTLSGSTWNDGIELSATGGSDQASGVSGNTAAGGSFGFADTPVTWSLGSLPSSTYTALGTGGFSGFANAVAEVGSDKIAVGVLNGQAVVWVNGAQTFLAGSFSDSQAFATNGVQHGGYGDAMAMLWNSNTGAPVSLHNPSWVQSEVHGLNSANQVGMRLDSSYNSHAIVWSGTAASAVDLHNSLPGGPTMWLDSTAWGIDAAGNIIGSATDLAGNLQPIVWKHSTGFTFSNFKWPMTDPGTTNIDRGLILPIRFSLTDCDGDNAPNVPVKLSLKDSHGNSVPESKFAAPWHHGTYFLYVPFIQEYLYLMPTSGLAKGTYTVTATVENTSFSHSASVRIR